MFHMFRVHALKNVVYLCDKPTNTHYKYVQSHIVTLHKHILVTSVTIIRVAYEKKTIVKKCMMLQLICKSNVTPNGFIVYICTLICILNVFLSQIMVTGMTETCW